MKRLLPLGLLLAALLPAAGAAEYRTVLPAQSGIGFVFTQMGVNVSGRFKKFSARLQFDPARPALGQAAIDVDLASVDTGSEEGDDAVAGREWFNTRAFPTAHFESTAVKALGGNRYQLAGKLSIKGHTRDVVVPASFAVQGAIGVFTGAFTLHRADFAIGEGEWAAFDTVANEVQVNFRITAAPGQPGK